MLSKKNKDMDYGSGKSPMDERVNVLQFSPEGLGAGGGKGGDDNNIREGQTFTLPLLYTPVSSAVLSFSFQPGFLI